MRAGTVLLAGPTRGDSRPRSDALGAVASRLRLPPMPGSRISLRSRRARRQRGRLPGPAPWGRRGHRVTWQTVVFTPREMLVLLENYIIKSEF